MSDSETKHNLMRGTRDLSGCHYPTNKISVIQDHDLGFAVARLMPTETVHGLIFDTQDIPESERVDKPICTLSFMARADVAGDIIHSEVWGSRYTLDTTLGTDWKIVTMPYGFVNAKLTNVFFNGKEGNSGAVYLALPMAVRGTTPAAWAPAEGETLAGGGVLMSANLLDSITPTLMGGTTESNGVWHNAGRTIADSHSDWLMWDLPDQAALATNQTYHVGLSVKGVSADADSLYPTIGYMDAAGHKKWAVYAPLVVGTSWGRAEATIVIPSGMTPFVFYVAAYGKCPEIWMASPTLSYGSPVALSQAEATLSRLAAISSVTRYYQLLPSGSSAPSAPTSSSNLGSWTASEPSANTAKDLWQCERTKLDDGTETWSAATKSSAYEAAKSVSADVRQLSDKVTATVSEQMKWNDSYSSRTSSLEQTAAGFSASLDSMSSTDASIHQWMSFGQGADGKPTLTIGTSGSDIVSKQTNSGLSYQTRGGTELMALDAASRSSTMPHMHADDVSIGNWQLGPTKNGTHFTLMWIGG